MTNTNINEKEQLELGYFLKAKEIVTQLNQFIEHCKEQGVLLEPILIEGKLIIKKS